MTKLMSGKLAAAPSMSQVWVCSMGCGPSGTPLCTPAGPRGDSRSVVQASSQTICTSAESTPGCASIRSVISVRTRDANGHQPEVSSNSTRIRPPSARTERTSPMSTTDMPFSRQHGS
jgi:hypothetical protein